MDEIFNGENRLLISFLIFEKFGWKHLRLIKKGSTFG